MKAIVQERYGSPEEVLELREVDKPVAEDGQVLVRVRAASVHPDVWHVVRGLPYVLRLPLPHSTGQEALDRSARWMLVWTVDADDRAWKS